MIHVRQLTKQFGALRAVDDLSFEVAPGTAVAFWGANGAGKTTALRCLLGLLPFQGDVSIDGRDVRRDPKAARRRIGFVPQELTFHDDLTVRETVAFYAGLKKVRDGERIAALLQQLALAPHVEKRVGDLSGGLKQRLALALALLADPPLLVLDEPTANLDITARDDFLALLRAQKRAGKTLIFSSHRLEEVTALADRVLLLEAGRLVIDAPPRELARRMGRPETLYLHLPPADVEPAMDILERHGMAVHRNGHGVRVLVGPREKATALRVVYEAGVEVADFGLE